MTPVFVLLLGVLEQVLAIREADCRASFWNGLEILSIEICNWVDTQSADKASE